jgi:hypothetical protein
VPGDGGDHRLRAVQEVLQPGGEALHEGAHGRPVERDQCRQVEARREELPPRGEEHRPHGVVLGTWAKAAVSACTVPGLSALARSRSMRSVATSAPDLDRRSRSCPRAFLPAGIIGGGISYNAAMRAMAIQAFGGLEQLRPMDLPDPAPAPGRC